MKPHETLKHIAPNRLMETWDISRTFLWRLEQANLLKPEYLFSRKLYPMAAVEHLEKMIASGELRSALRGAAKRRGARDHGPEKPPLGSTSSAGAQAKLLPGQGSAAKSGDERDTNPAEGSAQ